MISLNPENLTMLEKIQSSLLVFCLDDDSPHVTPEDYSQVFNYLVLFFLFFFKNLFLAVLGLCCFAWAFFPVVAGGMYSGCCVWASH